MIELLFVAIGLSLAVFFTVRFVLSIGRKGSFLPKLREWLRNIYDAISGIG